MKSKQTFDFWLFLSVTNNGHASLRHYRGIKAPKGMAAFIWRPRRCNKTQPQILASERSTFSSGVPAAICQDEAKRQGETSSSSLSSVSSLVSGVVNCAAPSPAWSRSLPFPLSHLQYFAPFCNKLIKFYGKQTTSECKQINAGGRETLCVMCMCL